MKRPLIFLSYSHKDEVEKDRLLSHVRAALQPDIANIFSDDSLGAGVDWQQNIGNAIEEAKVAILLVTADFLTSNFIIHTEVKAFLERREKEGLRVFPVIAKACPWKKVEWLKAMNLRPRNGRPIWGDAGTHVEEDLAAIAEEVADIIEQERIEIIKRENHADSSTQSKTEIHIDKPQRLPRILLVDDKALFRRSVAYNLEDLVTVMEAGSVAEAIKVLETNQDVRLILLDLELDRGEDGTMVLEHIKDRASDYRVIVLTGHHERLAAEKASSYKIFRYLPKAQDDAPREILRFNVEEALTDLKRGIAPMERAFGEETVKLYPSPFIHLFQYLKSDIRPGEALSGQKAMLELLLNFSAIALLCDYLYGDTRDNELDAQIRKRLYKPSLGDWFNIINEIVKRKNSFNDTLFLNSFLIFYTGRNKKNLNELISVRNKYVGHGSMQKDFEAEKVVKQCDDLLVGLLRDYQIITDFLMCYTLNVEKLRTGYVYSLKECTGANHQLLNSKRSFNFLLDAHEMHLVNLKTEHYQSLHPFIILENCSECRQPEVFFYSKFSNGQLYYLSYTCGHWLIKEESEKDFLQLLRMDS
ncbi:MAG TPA: response regulator [Pyrinomonadaceae bacterium]|nr:response regulator [Pyrinomonadaceae bacterium]